MSTQADMFSGDSNTIIGFISTLASRLSCLPRKNSRSTMDPSSTPQTGNTQAGQGQGGPAMALSDSHFQALVQMEGYTLLPEDDGRRSKTVAKAVSGGHVVALKLIQPDNMNKLTILEHLQTFQSQRNHTIKLLHVIHSDHIADIIVMPWQSPLNVFLCHYASLDMVVLLRFQIMEGVWFLHEHLIAHLDLKPANIFVGHTDSLSPLARLSIGDYGISVRVEDEESTVEGYRGTPFWSAPEVGSEDGPKLKYSAIRADRWSCGRVVHYLAQFHPLNDGLAFGSTYEQLLNPDPRRRPSLDEAIHNLQPVSVIKRVSSPDFALASPKRTCLGYVHFATSTFLIRAQLQACVQAGHPTQFYVTQRQHSDCCDLTNRQVDTRNDVKLKPHLSAFIVSCRRVRV